MDSQTTFRETTRHKLAPRDFVSGFVKDVTLFLIIIQSVYKTCMIMDICAYLYNDENCFKN